ncbi:MAG: hypothetical protein HQ488_03345 [Parcubacteria group bacterium]|nr:hypothetical protein [Parcubacteria group bacterium]
MEKALPERDPGALHLVEAEPTIETELRPEVRRLFEIIVRENPELSETQMRTFKPEDAYDAGGFYTLDQELEEGVIIPFIHVAEGGAESYAPLLEIRKASVAINAEALGIDPSAMTPELLELFILAHEMGHVLDFVSNYQRDPDLSGWDAPDEMAFHRSAILNTLPIPNVSPTGLTGDLRNVTSLEAVLNDHPKLAAHPRFKEMQTVEDLIRVQEEEYRASEPERYADTFAAQFLKKHSEELGLSLHEVEQDQLPLAA